MGYLMTTALQTTAAKPIPSNDGQHHPPSALLPIPLASEEKNKQTNKTLDHLKKRIAQVSFWEGYSFHHYYHNGCQGGVNFSGGGCADRSLREKKKENLSFIASLRNRSLRLLTVGCAAWWQFAVIFSWWHDVSPSSVLIRITYIAETKKIVVKMGIDEHPIAFSRRRSRIERIRESLSPVSPPTCRATVAGLSAVDRWFWNMPLLANLL